MKEYARNERAMATQKSWDRRKTTRRSRASKWVLNKIMGKMYLKPMTWWSGRMRKKEDEGKRAVYVPAVASDIPCGRPVPIDE